MLGSAKAAAGGGKLLYLFEDFELDTDRRELHRAAKAVAVEPKVFDLLVWVIRNRQHVVSKDDLVAAVWHGRIVSESALTTCINAARTALGDSGETQRLIKTLPRKGIRFIGIVREEERTPAAAVLAHATPEPAQPSLSAPSIAVLPFTNLSGDPEQEYFSDGITEDIITDLSRFHALLVIARNSSFAFKGKPAKVQDIARELGVAYIVEGSVRRASDRVRITAQLIDAGTGNHLWAERYDREMRDIFALQDEVAQSVASAVSGRVEAAGRDRAVRLSENELESYDLLLRAKALMSKYSRAGNEQALARAERAVELDPTSARAHTYAAWCLRYNRMFWWAADRMGALARAYELAKRAVDLDPTDSLAHCVLGLIHLARREFDDARVEAEKAVDLNPNDPEARRYLGYFLAATGNPEAGIEHIDLATRLNPFDTRWAPWVRGIGCFTARRYEEAIAAFRQARDTNNEVRGWLAASYAQAGRLQEARAALEEFLQIAESDMAVFPGRRLKDWEPYWHGAFEYRDDKDFDHLFDALRKAGMRE